MSEENICNFLCQYQEMTVIVISMSGTIRYGKNVNTLKHLNPLQGVAYPIICLLGLNAVF